MTQQDAIETLFIKLLERPIDGMYVAHCTGDIETCKNDECMICGVRDCPYNEPLHYHHDGCPACFFADQVRESDH